MVGPFWWAIYRIAVLDADREDWRSRGQNRRTSLVLVTAQIMLRPHRFVRFSVRPQNTVLALWFLREQKNFWVGPTNACQNQPADHPWSNSHRHRDLAAQPAKQDLPNRLCRMPFWRRQYRSCCCGTGSGENGGDDQTGLISCRV